MLKNLLAICGQFIIVLHANVARVTGIYFVAEPAVENLFLMREGLISITSIIC